MDRYNETTYGERIAGIYDDLYQEYDPAVVELLQEQAGHGRVLELGIGTGRIAIPLHQQGVNIAGLDSSQEMIDTLHAKPESAGIEVVLGNFLEIDWDARFDLIFIVFNTFFNLPTQEQQVKCFRSVAEHLTPDGVFLIDAFVPDMTLFDDNQTVRLLRLDEERVQLHVSKHHPAKQQVTSQMVLLTDAGLNLYPVKLRYAWPSELDLMAQLAGMKLKHRWGSWDKSEYNEESVKHISIYEAGK
jgi:SAM-dependent methyltransferase